MTSDPTFPCWGPTELRYESKFPIMQTMLLLQGRSASLKVLTSEQTLTHHHPDPHCLSSGFPKLLSLNFLLLVHPSSTHLSRRRQSEFPEAPDLPSRLSDPHGSPLFQNTVALPSKFLKKTQLPSCTSHHAVHHLLLFSHSIMSLL